jgi:TniQ
LSTEIQAWLLPVEPFDGESLSHFLGRFRRQNHLSPSALGDLAGVGAIIARWERFHLNPFPSDAELAAVADVVGVTPERFRQMLAPEGVKMKCEPIRLCGACCQEEPYHRLEWQYQLTGGCDRHQLRLLSKCRNCQAKFPMPALWEDGCCLRCRLSFGEMAKWQKAYV